MENTHTPNDDARNPSDCSSPTQVPTDDCPSTPDQMALSSLFALPLGRDGRSTVVDLAPGSTTWIDMHAVDPTLLPGLPRVENQYNEDYTDYAQQVHNHAHGSFPVAKPYEEWACRQLMWSLSSLVLSLLVPPSDPSLEPRRYSLLQISFRLLH